MEYLESSPFLVAWHNAMIIGVIIMAALGIVVFMVHNLKAAAIKELHMKYDYLNKNEIRMYKYAFACFGLAAMFTINLYGMNSVHDMGVWFFVRLFMSIAGGTLIAYISYLILEYYYPSRLDKKLKRCRYTPRINPKTGNKMRLLSEEEEDVHLDEGMLAEENVFSVDYDVWIDEKTGDVKIEKYEGRLQALRCNSCGFYTMRIIKEEVVRAPEGSTPGELVKRYECAYCKSVRATSHNISTKESEDYKNQKFKFKTNRDIDLVTIEIHSVSGSKSNYEFQNLDEAKRFLSEYSSD
jgi:hypothetical protein